MNLLMKCSSVSLTFRQIPQYAQGPENACFTYSKIFKVTVKVPASGQLTSCNSLKLTSVTLKRLHGSFTEYTSYIELYHSVRNENIHYYQQTQHDRVCSAVCFMACAANTFHFGQELAIRVAALWCAYYALVVEKKTDGGRSF